MDTGFGKRFAHVDLRTAEGLATVRGLIAEADVVCRPSGRVRSTASVSVRGPAPRCAPD